MNGLVSNPSFARQTWAEVDLFALSCNTELLCKVIRPAKLCAVVKADGYGHGADIIAKAALDAGASWLAVAMLEEGLQLRNAGITAPILLLSEPACEIVEEAFVKVLDAGLVPTVYTYQAARSLLSATRAISRSTPVPVHLKVDTGMHRLGVPPEQVLELAKYLVDSDGIHLEGLWTHLAVAEQTDDGFTKIQLDIFEKVRALLKKEGIDPPYVHAANSAGAIAHPNSRYDMVRCGISLYGYAPSPEVAKCLSEPLIPVMSFKSRVSMLRSLKAGEALSYGLRYRLSKPSTIATIPVGYADGVSRRLFDTALSRLKCQSGASSSYGGEVLIKGRRYPIAGTITMDQLLVDVGQDSDVEVGDEVVLLGFQGDQQITADDWAEILQTISYEVLCSIGPRVPRIPINGGSSRR
ncbi:MAG: alanine racemase [Actinobacteria bacterium]|nr:alanine racemase [Actinomycetota bacterium]MCL6105420.1 alanine racemase [Actinomycetota bacterium]